MSGSLRVYRKAVVERRRLYLDYSCWLEEPEELVDFQTSVSPYTETSPIVVTASYTDPTNKKLTMLVSGGVAGTQYVLQMVVRTDAGQIKSDDIGLVVT